MFRSKRESLCRNVRDMLSEYIDNRLVSEKKSLVERHLETCEACSKELESLRMTVGLLHSVPEVAVPHSFRVPAPAPKRERALGPASLRWLRPATAVVAIALIVLLVGDSLNAFESGANHEPGNLSGAPAEPTPVPIEMRTMVAVPGVMGQMSLATAEAVGYTDYTIVYSPPPPSIAAPGKAGSDGTQGMSSAEVGWPLRQIEIGLAALVFVLFVLIIFARRQTQKKASLR